MPTLRSLAALLAAASTAVSAQSPSAAAPAESRLVARLTLDLGNGATARFEARSLQLGVAQIAPSTVATAVAERHDHSAELRFVKIAGPYTGELVRRSASGQRFPSAVAEIVDDSGRVVLTIRVADVVVASDRIVLGGTSSAIEQQRLATEETLAGLATQSQDAQRQLAVTEELDKKKLSSRQEVARARELVAELRTRSDLARQRLSILGQEMRAQAPLEEQVTLLFGRLEVEGPAPR